MLTPFERTIVEQNLADRCISEADRAIQTRLIELDEELRHEMDLRKAAESLFLGGVEKQEIKARGAEVSVEDILKSIRKAKPPSIDKLCKEPEIKGETPVRVGVYHFASDKEHPSVFEAFSNLFEGLNLEDEDF